jgi:hypothetical protein
MKMLISEKEMKNFTSIPCECKNCNIIFYITKSEARRGIKGTRKNDFCSRACINNYASKNGNIECECLNCKTKFMKHKNQVNKYRNHFCNRSCAATFNNTHKTKGNRKSKLEFYLEKNLLLLYPNLEFHFNRKDAINSELDIYIPTMKLAFELNGIFHYEPIYGEVKLYQIQNNDKRKFQACLEQGIELCIIDSSNLKYFKESNAKPYLNIIIDIINKKNGSLGTTRTYSAFARS